MLTGSAAPFNGLVLASSLHYGMQDFGNVSGFAAVLSIPGTGPIDEDIGARPAFGSCIFYPDRHPSESAVRGGSPPPHHPYR